MGPVDLRTATSADVSDVIALWAMAAENASRPADTPQAVHALIQRDPQALIVACSADALIGSVIVGWDGWRYHLYRLAVHPDHRRKGVAHILLNRAEERCTELGATRLDAMVLDGNDVGQSLWTARGFRQQDEWSRWVKPIGRSLKSC